MSESQKYERYDWIKVRRAKPVKIEGQMYVSEDHHIEETNFLIDEIRKLAGRIDELNTSLNKESRVARQSSENP